MIRNFLKFVTKILFSSQQVLVTLIMFFALSSLLLFYLFFKTFETNYIEQLKSVFPNMYIATNKKIDTKAVSEFEVHYEIFDQTWSNVAIGFDTNYFYALGAVGVRSFTPQHIPPILQDVYKDENTLYVTQNIYELLESQTLFKGKIFMQSDKDRKYYSFNVVPFKIQDDKKWILFPNPAAQKLYRKQLFDKAVFYSKLPDDIALEKLQHNFTQPVFTWDAFISLSSMALKNSMLLVFSFLSLAIISLLLISFMFFAQTLFDDLQHLTRYAIFYGMHKRTLFAIYFIMLNAYIAFMYLLSYTIASFLNNLLVQKLWHVEQSSLSHGTLLGVTLGISAVMLTLYLFIEERQTSLKVSRG